MTANTATELESAAAEVETRREAVFRLRQRVAMQLDGAASLHRAEYELQGALKRLDRAIAANDQQGEGASQS